MKQLLVIFFSCLSIASIMAQPPQRTALDVARKQTDMMVRELHIADTLVIDTLFRLHLKYAQLRERSNTRADAMKYLQMANKELQSILTPEQYNRFMNQQINHAPHRHHLPCHKIIFHPHDGHNSGDTIYVKDHMPQSPPTSQR